MRRTVLCGHGWLSDLRRPAAAAPPPQFWWRHASHLRPSQLWWACSEGRTMSNIFQLYKLRLLALEQERKRWIFAWGPHPHWSAAYYSVGSSSDVVLVSWNLRCADSAPSRSTRPIRIRSGSFGPRSSTDHCAGIGRGNAPPPVRASYDCHVRLSLSAAAPALLAARFGGRAAAPALLAAEDPKVLPLCCRVLRDEQRQAANKLG